jgi:hypothetical protein
VEPIRERIEEFLQRHWHEGNRVLRVLAVAAAVLLVLLLALRALRGLRLLAAPVLTGAILVAGAWLLPDWLILPRVTTDGPVVRNGVAAVVVCGKKSEAGLRGLKGLEAATAYVPEPRTGGWWPEKQGECTIWYHRPPGVGQRIARHQRAHPTRGGRIQEQWENLADIR